MYQFLITPQFGEPVTATIAEEWDQPNELILSNGDSLSRKMIRIHIESYGLTPYGKAIGSEFLAPMDLHHTFATTEKFTLEPVVGEWLDYPEDDTAPTLHGAAPLLDSANGDSLKSFYDEVKDLPKEVAIENPSFTLGKISKNVSEQIAALEGPKNTAGLPITISGYSIKHIAERRRSVSDQIIKLLSDPKNFETSEVLPNDPGKRAQFMLVLGRDEIKEKSTVGAVEIVKTGNRMEIISVMTSPDRSLKKKRERKEELLGGQQPRKILDSLHHVDSEEPHAEADSLTFNSSSIDLTSTAHLSQVLDSASFHTPTSVASTVAIQAATTIDELVSAFNDAISAIDSPVDAAITNPDFGLKASGDKYRTRINQQTKEILERVNGDPSKLTEEDREILVQYSGRGGLKEENSLYEYYTPTPVAEGVWDAMKVNGFENGNTLEPSAGAGVFSATKSKGVLLTGSEIDSTAAQVNQLLHPEDQINNGAFESLCANTPDDSFDSVVGNIPFGPTRATAGEDPDFKHLKSFEEYFVLRSIDKCKPGGLIALICPTRVVDGAKHKKLRAMASRKAEFLGAHRMPGKTFHAQGTPVPTDAVFFRKHSRDVLDKIPDLSTEVLKESNVLWDEFINGKYFKGEGKRFVHGETVAGFRGDDVVDQLMSKAATRAEGLQSLKKKLTVKFDSRIDWALLDSEEPIARNYSEGDRKIINEREMEFTEGEWMPVVKTKPDSATLDPVEYGVSSVDELKALTASNHTLMKLNATQAMAAFRAFPDLFSEQQKIAIKAAEAQGLDEYKEQVFRGSLLGGLMMRMEHRLKQEEEIAPEELDMLQAAIRAEYEKFGDPKGNKGLMLAGDNSRYFGLFSAAIDKDGNFSDLMAGNLDVSKTTFDASNIKSITEELFIRQGNTQISLEDIQEAYKGKREIKSLGDIADEEGIAISPDGFIMPFDRYCSGEVASKIRSLTTILATEKDPRLKAKFQKQIDEINRKRKRTKIDDIGFGLNQKWYDRKYLLEFLREQGGYDLDYKVRKTVAKEDPDTGEIRTESTYDTEDTSNPFGFFDTKGFREPKGFDKQFLNYLNGEPTRTKKEDLKDFHRRVQALQEQFNFFMQSHPDADKVTETYNLKFNGDIPYYYSGDDLQLEGVSKQVKPHWYQNQTIRRLSEEGRGIMGLDVGLGKAQPMDAKILTPTGWTVMGNLSTGDEVISVDGTPTKVIGVFPQGEKEIFKVSFSDGTSTECCKEHLWLTQTHLDRNNKRRKCADLGIPKVRSLEEISETLRYRGMKNHAIPMVSPVQFTSVDVPVDPYVIGVLLGDGSLTSSNVKLTSVDADIIDRVSASLPDGVTLTHHTETGGKGRRTATYGIVRDITTGANPLLDTIKSFGLYGAKSTTKFIPDIYKFNSVDIRLAMLQGLMDTDGYVCKKGVTVQFSSSSKILAEDVQFIVQSLGGNATIKSKIPTYKNKHGVKVNGSVHYTVHMRMPAEIMPFSLRRKVYRVKPKLKYIPARYITAVEPLGVKEAQCIMVDHEEHLYVTDSFIVTHNTFSALGLAAYNKQMGRAKKTCIVVPNSVVANWYHEAKTFNGNLDNAIFIGFEPKRSKDGEIIQETVKDEKGEPKINKYTQQVMYQDVLKKDSPEQIFEKLWAIPQTNKSLVIMSEEVFKKIPLKPSTKLKYQEQWANRHLITDSDFEKAKKSYNDAKKEESVRSQFGHEGTKKRGEYPYYEDCGFDSVMVDEAHRFKNSYKTGKDSQKLAYLPVVGKSSDRATDMAIKMSALRDANNGRGPIMLSATPITNSPIEIFNMLSLVMPMEEFEQYGVHTPDDFVRVFGKTGMVEKLKITGKSEETEGLTGFQNLDGLRNLFHKYAVMKNATDVDPDNEIIKLPGSDDIMAECTLNAEQESEYEVLRAEAEEASKSRDPVAAGMRPIFSIMRDMERVTTDMDMFNGVITWVLPARYRSNMEALMADMPASRTYELYDPVVQLKEKHTAELQPIYKDEGDNFSVVIHEVFEDDVTERLPKFGIQENEVAHPITPKYALLMSNLLTEHEAGGKQIIFTEEKTQHRKLARIIVKHLPIDLTNIGIINADEASGAKLQKISDAYNRGDLNIVICNKKAEVGVNLQKGTTAIHHLTFPWTPASMQQRNGRGVRQGNTASNVRLYHYAAGRTMDEYRLTSMKKKAGWINDLINGDAATADNADVLGGDDIGMFLAADPEAYARQVAEAKAKKEAEEKEKDRQKIFRDMNQLRNAVIELDTLDDNKAADLVKLQERKVKAEKAIANAEEKLKENPKDEKAKSSVVRNKGVLSRTLIALEEHEGKWEAHKQLWQNKHKQLSGLLKHRGEKGELPFDSAILEKPDEVFIPIGGKFIIAAGMTFEYTQKNNWNPDQTTKILFKVTSVDSAGDKAHIEWLDGRARSEGVKNLSGISKSPELYNPVSLTPDEIDRIKLMSKSWSYTELNELPDKSFFYDNLEELKLSYGKALFRVKDTGSLVISSLGDIKDSGNGLDLIWPDANDGNLKKELAELVLMEMRRNNGRIPYSYDHSLMSLFFGSEWRKTVTGYGKRATEAEVRAVLAETWAESKDEFIVLSSDPEQQLKNFDYTDNKITDRFDDAVRDMGDNGSEIEGWIDAYMYQVLKPELEKKAQEYRAEKLRIEMEELKERSDYREVPPEIAEAFGRVGITLKYNYKSFTTPKAKRGRRWYGGETFPTLSRLWIQDENGKNGKLYYSKDTLKSRFGAKFTQDPHPDFEGAWWHVPASTDLQDLYEIIA